MNQEEVLKTIHRLHYDYGKKYVFLPSKHIPENYRLFLVNIKYQFFHLFKVQRSMKMNEQLLIQKILRP